MEDNQPGIHISLSLEFMGFVTFIVFLILKLVGTITFSWFWVFFPLWLPLAIDLVIFLVLLAIYLAISRRN